MSYKKGGCYSKECNQRVDVLIIIVFRANLNASGIISSVRQDVMTPTDISNESIVVIVTVRLLFSFCAIYRENRVVDIVYIVHFAGTGRLCDALMCSAVQQIKHDYDLIW